MSTELIVALISAVAALASVVISSRSARQQAVRAAELEQQAAAMAREADRRDAMNHYRDPLLWAAYDLQSRVFNIARDPLGFLTTHGEHGTERERRYARRNTLFVFAEYLGWVEILRRRVQFLDLGNRHDNREVMKLLHDVSEVLNRTSGATPEFRLFHLFRGEQRALGEAMITAEGEDSRCIGYAEFGRRLDFDEEFARLFADLDGDVQSLMRQPRTAPRLIELQNRLVDLITFLDPRSERFPIGLMRRLPTL